MRQERIREEISMEDVGRAMLGAWDGLVFMTPSIVLLMLWWVWRLEKRIETLERKVGDDR